MAEQNISLFSITEVSLREISTLAYLIPDARAEARLQLEEYIDKFRGWVSNHGSNLKQTDDLSLDYRLRESPQTRQMVWDHINDLSKAVQGAIAILQETDNRSKNEDPTFGTAIDEYVIKIHDTVISLYRMSSILGELKP